MEYHKDLYYGVLYPLIYINNLDEGITRNIWMFADEPKLVRTTKESGDKQKLKSYIDHFG